MLQVHGGTKGVEFAEAVDVGVEGFGGAGFDVGVTQIAERAGSTFVYYTVHPVGKRGIQV